MKIAIIAEDYAPNQGGIAEYASNLALAIHEQGHDVRVVAPHVSGDSSFDSASRVRVDRIGEKDVRRKSLGKLARWQALRRFKRELWQWYEAVYQNGPPDFAVVMSVSNWANLCIVKRVPYAVCVHGGDAFGARSDRLRSLYRKFVVNNVFKNAALICSNSEFTAGFIAQHKNTRQKTVVTYCGVSPRILALAEEYRSSDSAKTKVQQLLTMSRLVPFKAVDVLIESIAILRNKYPDIRLVIAGDGPEKETLQKLVSKLGLGGAVEFVGYISSLEEKVALFCQSQIFVQSGRVDDATGRVENFGIVFAEAGACSRPAIGPSLGGVVEVIQDGVTGFTVEPESPELLARAIDQLLADEGKLKAMGDAGYKRVSQKFSYQIIARAILDEMRGRIK